MHEGEAIKQALTKSKDCLSAIREILRVEERSYAAIAEEMGYRSRSTLSLVLTGRRNIPKSLLGKIAEVYNLSFSGRKILETMFRLDKQKEDRASLLVQLKNLQAEYEKNELPVPVEFIHDPIIFEIYAALGLFAGAASTEELMNCFSVNLQNEILKYLKILESTGFVKSHNGKWQVLSRYVFFRGKKENRRRDKIAVKKNFKKTLQDIDKVMKMNHQDILLANNVMAVSNSGYKTFLKSCRKFLEEEFYALTGDNRELVMRVQFAAYPVFEKKSVKGGG